MGPNCLQPFIFTLSSPSNNPLLLRPFSVHDLVVRVMTWRGWMVSWEMSVPEVAERRTARELFGAGKASSDCNNSCPSHYCYCPHCSLLSTSSLYCEENTFCLHRCCPWHHQVSYNCYPWTSHARDEHDWPGGVNILELNWSERQLVLKSVVLPSECY